MKKILKVVLVLILVAIIGAGGFVVYKSNQGISYDISAVEKIQSDVEIVKEDVDSVTIKKNSDGDFRVLMFTDTHLNGKKEKDIQTVSYIVKNITEQKLQRLDKYFTDEDAKVKVSFKRQANALTTEVMLDYAGKFVRATSTSDNFYDNIDVVIPKIEGQIRKYRTRFDKHQKNVAFKEDVTYLGAKAVEDKSSKLVKTKNFKLSPMTTEEAIEEMELLGHNFYVYLDAKTDEIKVLYLRNDGDLGLIEPQA
jgi:putative sigma-54 modulation protein